MDEKANTICGFRAIWEEKSTNEMKNRAIPFLRKPDLYCTRIKWRIPVYLKNWATLSDGKIYGQYYEENITVEVDVTLKKYSV